MKSDQEIYDYYHDNLAAVVQEMETERQRIVSKLNTSATIIYVTAALSFVLGNVALSTDPSNWFFLLFTGMSWMIGVGASVTAYTTIKKKPERLKFVRDYKDRFKDKVIVPLLTFALGEAKYYPTGFMHVEEYLDSRYTLDKLNKAALLDYRGEDLVDGTLGETRFRFSEVEVSYDLQPSTHRKYIQRSDQLSGDTRLRHPKLFAPLEKKVEEYVPTHFVLFRASFNKEFTSRVIVGGYREEYARTPSFLGKMDDSMIVKLEDPRFMETFTVYAEDQVEARYILSTTMMEALLALNKKTKYNIEASFTSKLVNIFVPMNTNLFEAPLHKSTSSYTYVEEYIDWLKLFIGIVDDLNLNTRIWGKQ